MILLNEIIHTIELNHIKGLEQFKYSRIYAVVTHSNKLINWDIVDESMVEHLEFIVQEFKDKIKMRHD